MIKNLLNYGFAIGAFIALSQNANGQTTESFEGEFLPPCWTQIDADGDGQNWFQYGFVGTAYEGTKSVASASWSGAPLTPDNYLVSPQMTIGAAESLTYYIAGQDPDYPSENYGVFVSTTGNSEADFTDELLVEVTDSVWTLKTIDMSAYEGEDIYIAFRHFDVTDQFYIKLDNVTLPGTYTNEGCEPEVIDPVFPPVLVEGAESFEADTLLPTCWQAIDEDGDGYNWFVLTGEGAGFDGNNVIASQSYAGVALTPDNYLITPQLELGTNDSLYYVVRAGDPNYPAENYSVLVSTTGTDIADFSDEVFTEVLETAAWEGRSINLSAYDNETIYIAFRHHGVSDQNFFIMDAIALPGTPLNCGPDAVTELETVESKLFPNPVTDNLNITSSLQGAATVSVFDAVGRVVLQRNVNLSQATFTQSISSLENGIYTIQISTADKMATERFVKQ